MLVSRYPLRFLCIARIALCILMASASMFASEAQAQNHPVGRTKTGRMAPMSSAVLVPGSETLNYTVPPQVQTFVDAWVEYNVDTCVEISAGSWTVTTAPKYGTTATGTVTGTLGNGDCPGVTFTFAAIYYTWTSTNPKVATDTFAATWTSPDYQEMDSVNITLECTPVLAPTIMFNGKNVAGKTTTVLVGEQIMLSGQAPTQACVLATASQEWSLPGSSAAGETAVGGATATTASGFTLTPLPSTTTDTSYGPFYWVYAGTFTMTYQYTLSNGGGTSPVSTATFTVKGGGKMSNQHYTKMTADNLTGCAGTPMMAYGKIVPYPPNPCTLLYPGSTFGMLFSPSGAPSGGTYSYVQLINSDSYAYGTTSCTTSQGVDLTYPYSGLLGTVPPEAEDAPYIGLAGYNNVTRSFNATMFLLWISGKANSITVPLGYQTWEFDGAATCPTTSRCKVAKDWTVTTSGTPGPVGSFTPSNGSQTTDGQSALMEGYPSWSGPAAHTCD